MPKPYPKEFRDDVVAVARRRDHETTLKQIAEDFGISETCLSNWLAKADRDEGLRDGATTSELTENRQLRRRVRLLEQENEVLRRAAAYLSQANLPGKGSTRSSESSPPTGSPSR
jgi:transposase